MKKILPLFLTAIILMSACDENVTIQIEPEEEPEQEQENTDQQDQEEVENEAEETEEIEEADHKMEDAALQLDYSQWIIPKGIMETNQREKDVVNSQDCINLMNGMTAGGDLLSTIIADPYTQGWADLKVYTPEYVMDLEQKIVSQTHSKFQSDLYAFKVCHLGDGVDAVAGYLWPQGTKAPEPPKEFWDQKNAEMIVVITHGDNVFFFEDIRPLNQTATGAEVFPCDAELDGENVIWSCFMGLALDQDGYTSGSKLKHWRIPLNGNKVETWEDAQK